MGREHWSEGKSYPRGALDFRPRNCKPPRRTGREPPPCKSARHFSHCHVTITDVITTTRRHACKMSVILPLSTRPAAPRRPLRMVSAGGMAGASWCRWPSSTAEHAAPGDSSPSPWFGLSSWLGWPRLSSAAGGWSARGMARQAVTIWRRLGDGDALRTVS